jgi:hypothetical protein
LVEFHDEVIWEYISNDVEGKWWVEHYSCPNPKCKKLIMYLVSSRDISRVPGSPDVPVQLIDRRLVRPKCTNRPPVAPEVPEAFAGGYVEACLVLADSPKASAALSRRCLQNILREKCGIRHSELANEIQEILDSKSLPSYISEIIDAVRNVGNFAAHPIKSRQTGEIIDVEPGEAELNLDVIEALFDFYFVTPNIIAKKKAALNDKLKEAGKPPIKG